MDKILGFFVLEFFSSPVILLYLIIAKIFFPKKIKNKIFIITSLILLMITILMIYVIAAMLLPVGTTIPLTKEQIINNALSGCTIYLFSFDFTTMILLPVILIGGVIFAVKNNNKTIAIKTFVTTLSLFLMLYLTAPVFYDMYLFFNKKHISDEQIIECYEKAVEKSVFKPMKAYYLTLVERHIFNKIVFSNNDVKYIDKWIQYKEQSVELLGYDGYSVLVIQCVKFKKYDEARKYLKRLEELGLPETRIEKLLKYINAEEKS